jgi:flagellar protein FlbD
MIRVTKLNKAPVILNLETVKYLESTPDTVVYFVNGESMMIRETMDEVVEKVQIFKGNILRRANEALLHPPTPVSLG